MVINDVQAIVTRQMDYKESSKILNILTKDYGLLPVMAQSANKAKSKYFSATNLFNIAIYDLSKGRTFYYLREASLVKSNSHLTKSTDKLTAASMVCELINSIIQEGSKEEDVYQLTLVFFQRLEEGDDPGLVLLSYLVKFASFLGFQPDLRACLACRTNQARSYHADFQRGGFICSNCRTSKGHVSREEFLLLNRLLYQPSEDISKLGLSPTIDLAKLVGLSLDYIKFIFDLRNLKVEKWIERINL